MNKLKKGDIVGRISYNKDVIFKITKIIKTSNNKQICILKGITQRIEADSLIEDLELMDKRIVSEKIQIMDEQISRRIRNYLNDSGYKIKSKFSNFLNNEKRTAQKAYTGRILHLDGDKRYSEKSIKYYRSLGLDAVVKNIPENKQSYVVRMLLSKYNPDILVITRT